jgi:hypothetical protein
LCPIPHPAQVEQSWGCFKKRKKKKAKKKKKPFLKANLLSLPPAFYLYT